MICDLNKLGADEFGCLAQALVQRIISQSAKIYGHGRDVGRDAVYRGKASYPSPVEIGKEVGYFRLNIIT
jgi:hypothetical protein